jgi:hypothetical protein
MTTAVKAPALADHKPYTAARDRFDKITRELKEITAEAEVRRERNQDTPPEQAQRARSLQADLAGAAADVRVERAAAQSRASEKLYADPKFTALLAETVQQLCDRLPLDYMAVRRELGVQGVHVPPLPDAVEAELQGFIHWLRDWRRRGILQDDQLPAEIRPFVVVQ